MWLQDATTETSTQLPSCQELAPGSELRQCPVRMQCGERAVSG